VVKVDSFLNHQVDPALTMEIGRTFADRFRNESVTKVLTVEASGIHLAMATAFALGVPFVYAKKKRAVTQSEEVYVASVYSFTRQETYQITVSKSYLREGERVLIIDDILAEGNALIGLIDIVRQANAQVVGVGIAIEKSFQDGRRKLEEAGVSVQSLVRIASMENGVMTFVEEAANVKVEE
jgi:xanthine phosphoribosyltransferase